MFRCERCLGCSRLGQRNCLLTYSGTSPFASKVFLVYRRQPIGDNSERDRIGKEKKRISVSRVARRGRSDEHRGSNGKASERSGLPRSERWLPGERSATHHCGSGRAAERSGRVPDRRTDGTRSIAAGVLSTGEEARRPKRFLGLQHSEFLSRLDSQSKLIFSHLQAHNPQRRSYFQNRHLRPRN